MSQKYNIPPAQFLPDKPESPPPRHGFLYNYFLALKIASPLFTMLLAAYGTLEATTVVTDSDGYVDFAKRDGSNYRKEGAGIRFSNPFNTKATKWEHSSTTLTFRSSPQELDFLEVEINVTYMSPSSIGSQEKSMEELEKKGDTSIKAAFREKNWQAYERVNPDRNPANASALCNTLSDDLKQSSRPEYVRDVTVTKCRIITKQNTFKPVG